MHLRSFLHPIGLSSALMALMLLPTATVRGQTAPDVAGIWIGTLDVGSTELRLVAHIERGEDGGLHATLDSPDQGATGIPVAEVVLEGRSIELQVPSIAAIYSGEISEEGNTINGHWSQGGAALPLNLERTESAPTVERPQEPTRPFPYREEDVRITNPEADVELAATLTLPQDPGRYPAVVLISGSGPQDRDEAVFGHRPFLVLADYLTRRGIAVLRYDDRGYGASTGDFSAATSADFASDARAAVEFLHGHDQIDAENVGLIGHSEGGIIAPMAALDAGDKLSFLVLLAAPAVSGEEILYQQDSLIAVASGATPEQVSHSRRRAEQIYRVLKSEPDREAARPKLDSTMRAMGLTEAEREQLEASGTDLEAVIRQQIEVMNSTWFRYFITYDPLPALEQVSVPVLAITGSKDLQVPPAQSLPLIRDALDRPGHEASVVREMPGLNHMFQQADTGHPREYAQIEHTFDQEALELIGDWILQITSGASAR